MRAIGKIGSDGSEVQLDHPEMFIFFYCILAGHGEIAKLFMIKGTVRKFDKLLSK